MAHGLLILARSLSVPFKGTGKGFAHGNCWQYHPRSDHHSKILCWGIAFDLLLRDNLIRRHALAGKISFGINHAMTDFALNREKNLDLVICRRSSPKPHKGITNFLEMVGAYEIKLSSQESKLLSSLPTLPLTGVQSALLALEAKAAMTEFGKARPRLYDELNSSQLAIHGDSDAAIAAGFALINISKTFISPLRNPWKIGTNSTVVSLLEQPRQAELTLKKVLQLPRRAAVGAVGFDALGVAMLDCANDGSPVQVVQTHPAPSAGTTLHYDNFIERIETIYSSRFSGL